MTLIPKLLPIDDGTSEILTLTNKISGKDLSQNRPNHTNGRYKKQPNCAYFLRFSLNDSGTISVAHHWYRQEGNTSWEHHKMQSMPTNAQKPRAIPPGNLNQLTEDYLDGNLDRDSLVELSSVGANFSWNWISWIVVIFDHPNWEFDRGRDPVLITTTGNPNHSYFEGRHVGTGGRRNAFAFVNLMSADSDGNELGANDKVSHKFDLVMEVKLADGTSLRVLVDPTGTNNGPGGGGTP
ncbi:hypothetical protein [Pontixanthobacter aquaemixtae]|uniref:Uncharacterized protein n=1 Tax=Pontixanthobacter aquaemixtae TaxID=1958940 RepID=A0A844ZW60_9SPHN|nr:hypothetical protein [Pontixanthobacter aquaemixtae]MXO90997.1 hypothetical protein [Pontixanthobacter aquaemixtae]